MSKGQVKEVILTQMEDTRETTMEALMEIVAEYYIFAPHEREIRQMAKRLIAEFRDRKKLLDSVIYGFWTESVQKAAQ